MEDLRIVDIDFIKQRLDDVNRSMATLLRDDPTEFDRERLKLLQAIERELLDQAQHLMNGGKDIERLVKGNGNE